MHIGQSTGLDKNNIDEYNLNNAAVFLLYRTQNVIACLKLHNVINNMQLMYIHR